jgi:hypothetical protein
VTADYIPMSVRCFAVPDDWKPGMRELPNGRWQDEYRLALVYDTETTIDRYQSLLVGSYLLCGIDWSSAGPRVVPLEEGLFIPDDLKQTDPAGYRKVHRYVRRHRKAPRVDPEHPDAGAYLRLLTRREFCELRYQVGYRLGGLIVCLNQPFDESRIAVDWTTSRSRGFERGFSLIHHTYQDADGRPRESLHRPRTILHALDSKRSRERFTRPARKSIEHTAGKFLDLRQLLFALTGEGHSLESGCAAFGVSFAKDPPAMGRLTSRLIDYARLDTLATAQLLEAALREYDRRALRLPPHEAYSAASMGKAALKQMGVHPILARQPGFPRDVLGSSMVSFYGGRAECRIRCTPVPIVLVDFLSNYATVCSLIGAWEYFTRERVDVVEVDPGEIEAWLDQVTLEQLYNPAAWQNLKVLCWVAPGDQNVLPVRGRYDATGRSDSIAVTPVTLSEPVPWMLADLAASKILTGKTPRLTRCLRIQAAGDHQPGLQRLHVPGAGMIDPRLHDYFQRLVELRVAAKTDPHLDEQTRRWVRQSLKTTVNATAYGINAEMNPRHHTKPIPVQVDGLEHFTTKTAAPEIPGEYCFPPLAAMITAGARLLLAMLEAEVTRRGGTWAFADTDSMAIVATLTGGLTPCEGGPERNTRRRACVRALTHAQVGQIVNRFRELNPYDGKIIPGSILEIDDASLDQNRDIRDLWAWSIAAKRYATFTWQDRRPLLSHKYSEHGLGHLADPRPLDQRERPLAADVWQHILDVELGDASHEPEWFARPAVTQRTISTPRLLRLLDCGHSSDGRLRPYSFCNHAFIHPDEPAASGRDRFDLVAPYERNPAKWGDDVWMDAETGRSFHITTSRYAGREAIRVKSIREVVTLYRRKREAKSLGPDMSPCTRGTSGLLGRPHVRDVVIRHIGKEANELIEVSAGLVSSNMVTAEYDHPPRSAYHRRVLPAIQVLPLGALAEASGLSAATIAKLRSGSRVPSKATSLRLLAALNRLLISDDAWATPNTDAPLLEALAASKKMKRPICVVCDALLTSRRAVYCSNRCRQSAYRGRRRA